MAHRIIYKPQGIILSSAIGDIGIDVDGDYVDVTLTAQGGIAVLTERYYAYAGKVTLYDIASLIEDEMRSSGLSTADFSLSVFTDTSDNKVDSCVLHVLYCDRFSVCTDVPKFLNENFLTTLSMRRVAPRSTVSILLYADMGESLSYSIAHSFRKIGSEAIFRNSYTVDDGKIANSSGVFQLNIPLNSIVADAAAFANARLGEIELLSLTVYCGQRSLSFFVDPILNERNSFMFRNCFNVWEMATLPVLTTAKTDVERSTAVINGRSRFYNQSTEKTYEVEAGPLTSDEAEWIDQLFSSYEVFRFEPNDVDDIDNLILSPVLITDCTCEVQDGDESLNTIKFTWRYADNRPLVRLSASPEIFTAPFNIVFS